MSFQSRINKILKDKDLVRNRVATYNGSEYLISYTAEEIEEIKKCKKDLLYTIKTYVKTLHPAKGMIPLATYDFQDEVVDTFMDEHFVIVLKSRQTGLSTITQALILILCILYPDFNVGVLSITSKEASYYLKRVRAMLDNLPLFLKPKIVTDNAQHLAFDNGSSIRTSTTTDNTFRSFSFNMLIIDEAAFINNIGVTFASMWPTLSRAFSSDVGRPYGVVIVSTPCGCGNFYHKTWEMAKKKLNDFVPITIHWSRVPEYDQAWYDAQCRILGYDKTMVAQELDLSFNRSGLTFFPDDFLDSVKGQTPLKRIPAIEMVGGDGHGELWIWEEPIKDELYIAGIDVATRFGYEFSCIQIINMNTGNQVAEFLGKVDTVDLAKLTIHIARLYNNAIVGIERNMGFALIDLCYKSGYAKIYSDIIMKERTEKIKKKKSFTVSKKKSTMKSQILTGMDKLGIWVSGVNRYEILNVLYRVTRNYHINPDVVRSDRTIIEAKSFIWKGETKTRPEHDDDSTDDTLFGLSYAWYVKSKLLGENLEKYQSEEQSIDALKIMSKQSSSSNLLEVMYGDKLSEDEKNDIEDRTSEMDSLVMRPDEIKTKALGRPRKDGNDKYNVKKINKDCRDLLDALF